jgi:hypothetical protein
LSRIQGRGKGNHANGLLVWRRPLNEMVTSVEEYAANVPLHPVNHQNFPNPFNPSTTIRYELPKSSVVTLSVYDVLGREVSVLVNERKEAGTHEVTFDAHGSSSGVYFCRMRVRPLDFPLSGIPPGAGFLGSGTTIGRDSKGEASTFVALRKLLLLR